ncbi:hypothetical protein K501DRAFT_287584 [Backusella circina FSU 941]|nr:hypothetical protein K501DRAFT_287584 [Backusella circina FSU 941]
MAVAMGATLLTEGVDDLSYATDLVICGTEHTVRPRLIHQAQERHIRIVSPLWIVSCFREQIYKDPYLFPYHMDNIRNTLALSSDVNEDPFHITHIEEERNHVFENSSHGRRSESPDTFSPSLPPQTPPRESKNPKPSRGVSAILNNQSFIDLVKKKQLEKQDEHLIRKDERRGNTSHRINKHPRKSTLFEKNGLAIWYTDKKK